MSKTILIAALISITFSISPISFAQNIMCVNDQTATGGSYQVVQLYKSGDNEYTYYETTAGINSFNLELPNMSCKLSEINANCEDKNTHFNSTISITESANSVNVSIRYYDGILNYTFGNNGNPLSYCVVA